MRLIVSQVRLPGLDGLRAFAALCVLFAHGGYFLFAAWPNYDAYAFIGWFGTEIFFALAGYLLVAQLLSQPPDSMRGLRRWWLWRAWRVLPLFWLALALHWLLAIRADANPDVDGAGFVVLAQNLAWPHPAFFGEAWNLPVLALFFFLAPMLSWIAGAGSGHARRMAWLLAGVVVIGVAVRVLWVLQTEALWDAGVRKIVVSRLDACAYGGLAACVMVARDRCRRGSAMMLGIVALACWALAAAGFFLLARDTSQIAGIGLFVLAGIGSALALMVSCERRRSVLPATAALARWSYPLYLINMPVLLAMTLLGFGQTAGAPQGLLRFSIWLVLSIALAGLVHRFVEVPLMAARARRLVRPGEASETRATSR